MKRHQKGEILLAMLGTMTVVSLFLATIAGIGSLVISDHYSGKPGIYCPDDGLKRPDCK